MAFREPLRAAGIFKCGRAQKTKWLKVGLTFSLDVVSPRHFAEGFESFPHREEEKTNNFLLVRQLCH
jgi:hypothetical protein